MFGSLFSSSSVVSENLLSDSAIRQLISAAPDMTALNCQLNSRPLLQHSRSGEQIAELTGSGSDFADYKVYQQGDDLRHIDWRASARSQDTLVRSYQSELSRPLYLLIDRRSTMRYATRTRLKVTQALRIALWLGGGEARSGREIAAVLADSSSHWLPLQQGMLSLKLMAKMANKPCPPVSTLGAEHSHEVDWKQLLSGLIQHSTPGSDVILISDFSGLDEAHNKLLRLLGNQCQCTAIQITDPSEISPFFPASVQLQWGDNECYLPAKIAIKTAVKKGTAITQLSNALQARSEMMKKSFQQANILYKQLSVEQDELSVFWFKTQK